MAEDQPGSAYGARNRTRDSRVIRVRASQLLILDKLAITGSEVAVRNNAFVRTDSMERLTDPARILETPATTGNT